MFLNNRYTNKIQRELFLLFFNSQNYAKHFNRTHAVCLGDSHVRIFSYIQRKRMLQQFWFDVCVVGGATAQGAINPNSKTDALSLFKKRITKARPFQTLIFQLGEVDCGFVIWYYSQKYQIAIEDQLRRSATNYISFLLSIKKSGFKNIIALSAPLPTIFDGQDWGEIANARNEIKVSLIKRTELTIRYNHLVCNLCHKNNIMFFDTTIELLDKKNSIIKSKFMNKNKCDHHLDNFEYGKVICNLLCSKVIKRNLSVLPVGLREEKFR